MDNTIDEANSHQGLEGALGSSTHHFLAWCTSDQPKTSQNVIKMGASTYIAPHWKTRLHRHGPKAAYRPCTLTLQVNS